MRRLRLSIAGITTISALVAIDCLAWSYWLGSGLNATVALVVLGSPLMMNALTIGLLVVRRRRKQGKETPPFLVGFEAAGWASLLLYLAGAVVFPEALMAYLVRIVEPLDLYLMTSAVDKPVGTMLLEYGVAVASLTGLQLVPALAGGWAYRRGRIRATTKRRDQVRSERSPVEEPSPPVLARLHRRLWLLFVVHLLGGLLATGLTYFKTPTFWGLEEFPLVPLLGVVLCQACLLGFWAAFSQAAVWKRLALLLVGAIYLEILVGVGGFMMGEDLNFLASSCSLVLAGILAFVRRKKAHLQHFPGQPPQSIPEGLRFSIRGLMAFTLVFAVLVAGVKGLREHSLNSSRISEIAYILALWSVFFVVTGLAAIWAALGRTQPFVRCTVVLTISVVLGGLFPYGFNAKTMDSFIYIISIMVLQAVILLASLLVVRSCGYRFVRRTPIDIVVPSKKSLPSAFSCTQRSRSDVL
jgi:hypothetical protein